ncbi:MAG: hypothetical protein KYX62_01450 [Pseudomonadota bacterium]|nr:hypothetical protein [Pseudomonadota bacterium]
MKQIVIMALIAVVAWYVLGRSDPADVSADNAAPYDSARVSSADTHFTIQDMAQLDCYVTPDLARSKQISSALGTLNVYSVKSKSGCKVRMVSTLMDTAGYDAGIWAGSRAQISIMADKAGYQTSTAPGNLGSYSEVITLTKNGRYRGFEYLIQWSDSMQTVAVLNAGIRPDARFENLMRSKHY